MLRNPSDSVALFPHQNPSGTEHNCAEDLHKSTKEAGQERCLVAGVRPVAPLGAGRVVFLHFTVFLLTSSISSLAIFHLPTDTYRLSQIADKALIFDGNIA